jgi:DNA-binding PadR family transcriptional regulator
MALSHAILTALLEEDLSGYQLAKRFDTSLGYFWRASHQQIYQDLRKMSENGWLSAKSVEQSGKPNKVIYSLTRRGKDTLDQWMHAPGKVQPGKDDLLVKLFNVGHSDSAPILNELDVRQAEAQERLALYLQLRGKHYNSPESLPDKQKGRYLTLLLGIRQEELNVRWYEDARSLLSSVKTKQHS